MLKLLVIVRLLFVSIVAETGRCELSSSLTLERASSMSCY